MLRIALNMVKLVALVAVLAAVHRVSVGVSVSDLAAHPNLLWASYSELGPYLK